MRRILPLLIWIAACAPQRVVTQPNAEAALAGQKLFRQHCASCHGADAAGTHLAPQVRSVSMNEQQLFRFLTNGDLRHGMPSWSRLPDQRRWQIVAYLRSLPGRRGSSS